MQKVYVVKFGHFLGLCKLTAPNHPLFPWSLIHNGTFWSFFPLKLGWKLFLKIRLLENVFPTIINTCKKLLSTLSMISCGHSELLCIVLCTIGNTQFLKSPGFQVMGYPHASCCLLSTNEKEKKKHLLAKTPLFVQTSFVLKTLF
jgi:hypothetical protein